MSTSIEGLSLVTVIALIRKEIAESAAASVPGKDGAQGVKGDRGAKGDSGPAGRQGPKGSDGKQGKHGKDGSSGGDGACGEDGVGIEDITQDGDGAIIVTMTDGEVYTLDMPLPGETQVHYKVGGGSSSGGDSGSVDLSNYVKRPTADKRDGSWLVYREDGTTKEWTPVTTDLVATNSDVLFRDAKGRFKSTETLPDLNNQLEVNRWFLEQIEGIEAGELDLPEMTSEATGDTLVLRDGNGNAKFNLITAKNFTMNQPTISNNTADTWFLSGGETSNHGVKKNDAAGMRSSLDVYSKAESDALGGGGGESIDTTDFAKKTEENSWSKQQTFFSRVTQGVNFEAIPREGDGSGPELATGEFIGWASWVVESNVLGGINIVGQNTDRPDLPFNIPEAKSRQYALTVDHETLGRTVEIEKEGIIRANSFTDMDGNPIGGGEGGIEEAPSDGAWYGRKDEGWQKSPAFAKAQIERASNLCKMVFRQPRDPNSTSADFELSVGPLTRGAYVEDEVGEMAVLANWADYDTITCNPIRFSMRHAEVGDYIEVGDINSDNRTGTILKLTSVEINEADGRFSGAFGYELVGTPTDTEQVQKGNSYHFHLQKKHKLDAEDRASLDVYSKAEADALFGKFGAQYVYKVDEIGNQAVANRNGCLKVWGGEGKNTWQTISFWPTDINGNAIPALEGEFILEVWGWGKPHELSDYGDWFRCKAQFNGPELVGYIKGLDYADESYFTFKEGSNVNIRMYKEESGSKNGNTKTVSPAELIETLSTLRDATQDETTVEGLRDSIGNAIGEIIEKFEAQIKAVREMSQ